MWSRVILITPTAKVRNRTPHRNDVQLGSSETVVIWTSSFFTQFILLISDNDPTGWFLVVAHIVTFIQHFLCDQFQIDEAFLFKCKCFTQCKTLDLLSMSIFTILGC